MSAQPQVAVGKPLSRVDGILKVTGRAKYAAEHDVDRMVHAVVVDSAIGLGRIRSIDTRDALAEPGVLKVISHLNAPQLAYRENRSLIDPPEGERLHVFQDDEIRFFGQPVAVVVATTLERAQHAASLVKVAYSARRPSTDLHNPPDRPAGTPVTYERGNADSALASSAIRLDLTYRMERTNHNAMEPHATIARWEGNRLTVWDKTQFVPGAQAELAAVFGIRTESVRVISPFVGGGFGSALRTWPHVTVAAVAARETGRPVKLVLTREQLYFGTGYRPAYEFQVRVGSDARGRLTAMVNDIRAETSSFENFRELGVMGPGQMMYSTPNVRQSYRTLPLDVHTPTWQRGPGYATASFVIETAMDELATELGIDPIELRRRNEPTEDESSGLPFSTRRLRECYTTGAREFGWERRATSPRSSRDGDWLVGTGMAGGAYHTFRSPAKASVRLQADGRALMQAATSDMGPGTYTSMSQVAADGLGVEIRNVAFRLGDSRMPPTPPHGGSMTMASVGSAVQDGCDKVRKQAIELAVVDEDSPLYGADPDAVVVRNGRLQVKGEPKRGESYRQLLSRNGVSRLDAVGSYSPQESGFSLHAYGATFAEVAVNERLGMVRVRRMLGVYDAGRIISPKLADSQAIGGMVGGIGQALLEHTVIDHRDGRIVNANLADYLVPVNADVPDLRAIYLNGEDPEADPIGVKGLGEVVQVGVAAALANAVFHATGRRVRDLPITVEALL